jgi:hypothetical protein
MVVRGNRGRPLSWLPQARSGPSGREDGLHGPKAIRVAEGPLRERSLVGDAPVPRGSSSLKGASLDWGKEFSLELSVAFLLFVFFGSQRKDPRRSS